MNERTDGDRQVAWMGEEKPVVVAHESLWEEPERVPELAWSIDIPGLDPDLLGV